jgi:hypothetical protein
VASGKYMIIAERLNPQDLRRGVICVTRSRARLI